MKIILLPKYNNYWWFWISHNHQSFP